ncbi:DUF547 domain-containing protein [Salinibaculum salinum]|uniref:DUF547 domain-containing protein n=1 Tax=Salinibaculum salinum TaxID=3131996 RepID=UPI0030EB7487
MSLETAETLSPIDCSAELLAAYRTGGDPTPFLTRLGEYDDEALGPLRTDRNAALAFWSNLYNAGTQGLLDTHPGLYEGVLRSLRFFSIPAVRVAGHRLSLDDIEHGLLRGRSKYGLGYLPRVLPDTFEMRYRLDSVDPRIHFALNCGAESCPAIRAYTLDAIDDQLDMATRAYLDATVRYDPDTDRVRVPRVMGWYRSDFGGKRGIRTFLQEYDAIPVGASPEISFLSWDWTKAARRFADEH